MQAKKATKIGDYDTMHKWKRITIIFNSIALGIILLTYFTAFIVSFAPLSLFHYNINQSISINQ